MDDLLKLAERCEAATGPDAYLDRQISKALGVKHYWRTHVYTASLDAAMTLVPEGSLFTARSLWDGDKTAGFASVSRYENAEFGGHYRRYWMDEHQANSATPALALCSAALRARSSVTVRGE